MEQTHSDSIYFGTGYNDANESSSPPPPPPSPYKKKCSFINISERQIEC